MDRSKVHCRFFVCEVRTVTVVMGTCYSLILLLVCPFRFWMWRKAPTDYRYFNKVLYDLVYYTSVGWWSLSRPKEHSRNDGWQGNREEFGENNVHHKSDMAFHLPFDCSHSFTFGDFLLCDINVLSFKYCGVLCSDAELW